METTRFGRTKLVVSRIAFGGIPIQRLTRSEGIALVRQTLDEGVNFIDTAHGYGHSEELIGEALKGRKRTEVILASKSPALDKAGFMSNLEESLKRLNTDYIDILIVPRIRGHEVKQYFEGRSWVIWERSERDTPRSSSWKP